jgi:hypothetical protein
MRLEKLAEAPFNDAQADIVLQSSDKVHFRVFKIILSLASPIFADMFNNIPSAPSQKPLNEVQVVHLSEHSTALDVALRHIYPVRPPEADSLHYASILAEFSRKFEVEALDKFITSYLMDSVERDPVGVYAIAATYGYKDIEAIAARTSLNLPFSGLKSPYMRCATAENIAELVRYHVACGEAASGLASSDRTWFLSLEKNKIVARGGGTQGCRTCSMLDFIPHSSEGEEEYFERRSGPRCLWNYLYRSALVLAHHPTAGSVTTEAFVLKSNDCSSCAQYMRGDMLEIGAVLGREIKNAVQRVSLSPCHVCNACSYVAGSLAQGCFRGSEERPSGYRYKMIVLVALLCTSGRYDDLPGNSEPKSNFCIGVYCSTLDEVNEMGIMWCEDRSPVDYFFIHSCLFNFALLILECEPTQIYPFVSMNCPGHQAGLPSRSSV